jgi:hypothetical protein
MTQYAAMSERRHRRGPVAAARIVKAIADPAFRRQGFAEAEVLTRWSVIVGKDLARIATPEKLTFRRGSPAGGTLHVRAAGPAALELQHMAPTVIERINTYYGYRAVERLHIVQGPPRRAAEPQAKAAKTLPAEERAALDSMVDKTSRDDLKAALRRLGTQVLARSAVGEKTP